MKQKLLALAQSPVFGNTRYRDAALSWIAVGVLLASWHVETRLDPGQDSELAREAQARQDATRAAALEQQPRLWLARSENRPSWIARAQLKPGLRTR